MPIFNRAEVIDRRAYEEDPYPGARIRRNPKRDVPLLTAHYSLLQNAIAADPGSGQLRDRRVRYGATCDGTTGNSECLLFVWVCGRSLECLAATA